jgi:hypothetical protein
VITNGKVLKWSEPVEQAYANAVDRIIVNTARHLKSGRAIHTAKWEVQKLSEMGQLTAENARIINDALKQMPKQMRDALDDTAKESLKLVDEAIEEAIRTGAIERSPISSTQGIIDELSQQALDQLNLVNTTMLESSQKAYLKVIGDTVMWENRMMSMEQTQSTLGTLNDASVAVLSGGETRTLALRRAIKELNAAGLYGFVDKRGRHWSPEAYVNMCVRTTVHNVAVRSVRGRQEDYGSSIFQCSYHPASRTEHYPFQNKFYDWNGQSGTFTDGMGGTHQYESVTVTGYGTAAGLFGINCGHFPLPQIPGVTVPSDPDMQSAETDARQYKESQVQRRLERNIRMSKRLVDAYKAAGDDKGAEEAQEAVRIDQAKMREFIERTGRPRRYDREQITGYGPDKLVRPKPAPAPKPAGPTFTPAKTIEEAEAYLKTITDTDQFGALGVSYKGVSVDVANTVNRTLGELYNTYNVPKIGGIKAPVATSKEGRLVEGAVAGYSPIRNSFYLNRKALKTLKTAAETVAENNKVIRKLIEHPELYDFDRMSKRLKQIYDAYPQSGRATVPETVEEAITHEFGHSLEKLLKKDDAWKEMSSRWEEFAPKVSGYATTEISEYIAESFASYRKGEKVTDPLLIEMFERLKR